MSELICEIDDNIIETVELYLTSESPALNIGNFTPKPPIAYRLLELFDLCLCQGLYVAGSRAGSWYPSEAIPLTLAPIPPPPLSARDTNVFGIGMGSTRLHSIHITVSYSYNASVACIVFLFCVFFFSLFGLDIL